VTSPDNGTTGATDLPEYAPIPQSALGPALNDQRYYVGRVERNLYWVTDGVYQSAFLTTSEGVVLFDAPPSIGPNLRRAVDEIASANGVSNRVTHLVYSHHHADHAGAASLFGGDVVRIGHEDTRRLLLRDDDPARPAPEITFRDTYTLEAGGDRVELAWRGPNHTPDNIYIHFPDHDTLMFIDVVNAGWVPIYNVNLSEDVMGYMGSSAIALSYPWTHLISGHLGRLATRDDVAVHQQYIADIEDSAREALASVDPVPFYVAAGQNMWAGVKAHLDTVTDPRHGAHRRQVHRCAGRRGHPGVHQDHDVPDHAVAPSRPRGRRQQTGSALTTADRGQPSSGPGAMVEGGQVTPHHQDPVTAGLALPAGRRQQPQVPGAPHGRGPVTDLELGVNAADLRVDGIRRDGQLTGDLRPGQVGRQIPQYPELARAELLRRRQRGLFSGRRG
jgi:glyoxylase-like metal-dependent hydrolase (beta-lactamase superfamily II)